jgi:Uma2 family endonuclease
MTHLPGVIPLTVEEYLRLEEQSDIRHEYVAGVTYAMTGATLRHNRLLLNIATRLRAVQGARCSVFVNDVKVRAAHDVFYYPDVVVACGELDDSAVFLSEPCLIVEVTSPSTRRIDRREKLLAYCDMPSLRAYLIVDQRRRWVEAHTRDADGVWVRAELTGDDELEVPCPATRLALRDIYEGVSLSAVGESEPEEYGS